MAGKVSGRDMEGKIKKNIVEDFTKVGCKHLRDHGICKKSAEQLEIRHYRMYLYDGGSDSRVCVNKT